MSTGHAEQEDFSFQIEDWQTYRVANYPSLTPSEARKKIVGLLKESQVMVNIHPTDPATMNSFAGSEDTKGEVAADGIVWVTVHKESGNDTGVDYKIEFGKPVCWDFVTGQALTGVHPSWSADEAYVVGTAMHSFTGPGYAKIPVKLERPGSTSDEETAVVIVDGESAGDSNEYPVKANSKGVWNGYVLKVKTDAPTFGDSEFLTRFEPGEQVWLMAVDVAGGSSCTGATLIKGARYVAKKAGSYTVSDVTRSLYVFARYEHTSILTVTDPNDDDAIKQGEFVEANNKGMFFVKTVVINPEATDHSSEHFTTSEPAYMVFVDKMFGNATANVRVRKGDRYIGMLTTNYIPAEGSTLSKRPLYIVRRGYDTGVPFKNTYSGTIPAYGCMEVDADTAAATDGDVVHCTRPGAVLKHLYLANGPEAVEAGEYGYAQRGGLVEVLYNPNVSDSPEPQPQQGFGPTVDQFYLTKGHPTVAIVGHTIRPTDKVMHAWWQPVASLIGKLKYDSEIVTSASPDGQIEVWNADRMIKITPEMTLGNIQNLWCKLFAGKFVGVGWAGTQAKFEQVGNQ